MNNHKITTVTNATNEKDGTVRAYNRGTDLASKVRGFPEDTMTELIPKGRARDVKGDGGKRTEQRSISAAQKQVYVRLRAPYKMRLERQERPHRSNRPW